MSIFCVFSYQPWALVTYSLYLTNFLVHPVLWILMCVVNFCLSWRCRYGGLWIRVFRRGAWRTGCWHREPILQFQRFFKFCWGFWYFNGLVLVLLPVLGLQKEKKKAALENCVSYFSSEKLCKQTKFAEVRNNFCIKIFTSLQLPYLLQEKNWEMPNMHMLNLSLVLC